MTVFVYVNTAKQVGDVDHIKVFAALDAAETWFEENGSGLRVRRDRPAGLVRFTQMQNPSA
ncbi:hypothetical protein [Bradyrhizobium cosmicum]|uniref:hypothetical protein n=1 Tax=Bradyrhizobium cosmicum TaxID=1404864 RepID=UPI0028E5F6C3|nr:hypothetical protein [Bradyrhizobium cosmicum]